MCFFLCPNSYQWDAIFFVGGLMWVKLFDMSLNRCSSVF